MSGTGSPALVLMRTPFWVVSLYPLLPRSWLANLPKKASRPPTYCPPTCEMLLTRAAPKETRMGVSRRGDTQWDIDASESGETVHRLPALRQREWADLGPRTVSGDRPSITRASDPGAG